MKAADPNSQGRQHFVLDLVVFGQIIDHAFGGLFA